MTTAIMEKQDIIEGETTLVRRVSDLVKAEGNNSSGPPKLLRHTSMQKLRHCCQNLNLFPILLYSFGQPNVHPMPMSKVSIAPMIARLTERINRLYSSLRCTIIRGLGLKSMNSIVHVRVIKKTTKIHSNDSAVDRQKVNELVTEARVCGRKFEKFVVQKPKCKSLFLKLAVYLIPLLLTLQLVGIFGLMIFGKQSLGFLFLFTALIVLGVISMKILNHDITAVKTYKSEKRKVD